MGRPGLKRGGEAAQDGVALGVPHGGRLAVHEAAGGAHDVASEHLPDALVPHAHTEYAKLGAQLLAHRRLGCRHSSMNVGS